MALVEAAKYFDIFAAGLARARLEAEDVPCVLFDTETNWGGMDLGVVPIRLMVDDDDLQRAKRILDAAPPAEGPS